MKERQAMSELEAKLRLSVLHSELRQLAAALATTAPELARAAARAGIELDLGRRLALPVRRRRSRSARRR